MRSALGIGTALAVLIATPALAQRGPPEGVPGGERGAGPPITPPGQLGLGAGTADYARDTIASQRGAVGFVFADQKCLSAEERRQLAEQYRAMAERYRQQALQLAEFARAGEPFPANAADRIRKAMEFDLLLWREQFQVGRREWQAMRDQWLAERDSLSAQQWALRRADWFAARDAWIAAQRSWAQSRGE